MSKEIFVYISLSEEDIFVGKLWCHNSKGKESTSFEYDKNWLNHPEKFALEPTLQLTEGIFHNQNIFGAIGDSAPDRWGRILMRKAQALKAKAEGAKIHTLTEADYLLGVNDGLRQGALRFADKKDGQFLSYEEKNSVPPLIVLSKLLAASDRFVSDKENAEDLKLLLAPGSSLGGARPKASVIDHQNNLAIAKFPKKDDEFSIVKWEAVALTLASKAGIKVPDWHLEMVNKKPVLITKRFDRNKKIRIAFLSAMSMLQAKDNERHNYIEIAYALARHGAYPNGDMAELWRRMVFNILISNTDDHLRNHGFLYERQKGWRLSPAFDLNPTPIEIKPRILTTAIDFNDNETSLDAALSVIKEFRLEKNTANEIIREVAKSVVTWQETAKSFKLNKREIDFMSSAFEHDDLEQAQKI